MLRISAANVIFERDVGVRLVFANATRNVLFDDPDNDPIVNGVAPCTLREANRLLAQIFLNPDDYDLGFLFSSGGTGGCAWYVVCRNWNLGDPDRVFHKARGAGRFGSDGLSLGTGLLLHEVGHQLGARHTYSGQAAGCDLPNFDGDNDDGVQSAYEPGSGTTIMSYSNCGSDNVELGPKGLNRGTYYHAKSIEQITDNVFSGDGATCGSLVNTGNSGPSDVTAGKNYVIPQETPFVLEGAASDPDSDALSYTWEQIDLVNTRRAIDKDPDKDGPLIRSIPPTEFPDRTVPDIRDVLANRVLNDQNRKGTKLPESDRNLNFRLTVRDNRTGGGGVAHDDMVVTTNGDPFFITSPNFGTLEAGCPRTINWAVGGSQSLAENVKIDFSTTNGLDANGEWASF
ncbi:MAG: reprolysin-like metallopeptidase [Gammaproteobacteria bacterium]